VGLAYSSAGDLIISGGTAESALELLSDSGIGGMVGERGGDMRSSARRFGVAREPRLLFVLSVKPVTHVDRGRMGLIGEDCSSLAEAGRMGGFGKLIRPMAEYTSELLSPLSGLSRLLAGTGGALMDSPSSYPAVLVPMIALVDTVDMTVDRGADARTDSDGSQFCLTEFMTLSQAMGVLGPADARVGTSPML